MVPTSSLIALIRCPNYKCSSHFPFGKIPFRSDYDSVRCSQG